MNSSKQHDNDDFEADTYLDMQDMHQHLRIRQDLKRLLAKGTAPKVRKLREHTKENSKGNITTNITANITGNSRFLKPQ